MQREHSVSDLLLVKDIQVSALGFSEGHASEVNADAMRTTASMADNLTSRVAKKVMRWCRWFGRLTRGAPSSDVPEHCGDDVLVAQTSPPECIVYDEGDRQPSTKEHDAHDCGGDAVKALLSDSDRNGRRVKQKGTKKSPVQFVFGDDGL